MFYSNARESLFYRFMSLMISFTFAFSTVWTPANSFAQSTAVQLPTPGVMLTPSTSFIPAKIIGVNLHPENPLRFDFIIDEGNSGLGSWEMEEEATKLIKYFLAALTVPEQDMWVNLSPYEKDRIIPQAFGDTEMGRDLLAQDYLLKQLTASLMYPEEELGEEFWNRVQERAAQAGVQDIPFSTFNKVWIVPETALVYEHTKGAVVVDSKLKVMLEEDYLAMDENQGRSNHGLGDVTSGDLKPFSGVSAQVVREIIIPEIEKEVNTGETFANLRQIFNSVILANWYKQSLRESLLGKIYVNQKKVDGVDHKDPQAADKIYNQYLEAFKLGVYDYIKDEYDPNTQEVIPRKYFSGGVRADGDFAMVSSDDARLRDFISRNRTTANYTVDIAGSRGESMDIFRLDGDSAMLPSVAERVDSVYKPWMLKRLSGFEDRVESLIDDYFEAQAAENWDELKEIEGEINAIVDQVNVDQRFQQARESGTLTGADTFTLAEFMAQNDGRDFEQNRQLAVNTLLQGGYVPQFLFAGKATRLGKGAMFPLNLWELAEEQGMVEQGQESSYKFGMGPRQIIAYRMKLESLAREAGLDVQDVLNRQQLVINLNDEVESEALDDLIANDFYGFNESNIYFINQPEFKGYRIVDGELVQAERSSPLVYGHGDNAIQLAERGEAYQVDSYGNKTYVSDSVLDVTSGKLLASHRINDMTKLSAETVVDIDKLALAVYLHNQGHSITADLVSNPLKTKGGTATNLGLLEGLAAKSPELTAFVAEEGEKGAPYNAFRLTYDVDALRELLENNEFPYYLRFKDGFLYLEAVTGDLTQIEDANTRFIQREGDLIQDFKQISEPQMELMTNAISGQDAEFVSSGVAPSSYANANVRKRTLDSASTGVDVIFGTSGWRTNTNEGFNINNVGRVAKAAAIVLKDEFEGQAVRAAVGYDARPQAREYAMELAKVLAAYGIGVDLIDQVTPTPVMAEATRQGQVDSYDIALQVTASHNPVYTSLDADAGLWQGIKVLRNGIPASDEFTGKIARVANDTTKNKSHLLVEDIEPSGVDLIAASAARIRNAFKTEELKELVPDAKRRLAAAGYPNFGVIIDSMGGSTVEASQVLYDLGVIEGHLGKKYIYQAQADGSLQKSALDPKLGQEVPWRPEPQGFLLPELNQRWVRGKFGAAMDGDGDRAVFYDIDGETEITPNELGLIFAHYLYEVKGETGVVTRTIPTTHSLDKFAQARGLRLEETPVGSKHFAPYATGQDEDLLVGIEESGHVFFKYDGEIFADSAVAEVMLALEIIITQGKSLTDYLNDIYEEQGELHYVRTAVDPTVVSEQFTKTLKRLRADDADFPVEFSKAVAAAVGKPLQVNAAGEIEEGITYDLRDKSGIKVNFADGTFTMYRISGTDGSIRIYAEDSTPEGLDNTTAKVSEVIQASVANADFAQLSNDQMAMYREFMFGERFNDLVDSLYKEFDNSAVTIAHFDDADFVREDNQLIIPLTRDSTPDLKIILTLTSNGVEANVDPVTGNAEVDAYNMERALSAKNVVDRRVRAILGDAAVERVETAIRSNGDAAMTNDFTKGGIDLNPAMINMNVDRENGGIEVPVFNFEPGQVEINGLVPVIINVTPVYSLPTLIGMADIPEDDYAADHDSDYYYDPNHEQAAL